MLLFLSGGYSLARDKPFLWTEVADQQKRDRTEAAELVKSLVARNWLVRNGEGDEVELTPYSLRSVAALAQSYDEKVEREALAEEEQRKQRRQRRFRSAKKYVLWIGGGLGLFVLLADAVNAFGTFRGLWRSINPQATTQPTTR